MSVATEISRIQTARNTIRAKAVELGIGTSVDTLDKLATEIEGIENRGAVSAQVQEGDTYTIPKGRCGWRWKLQAAKQERDSYQIPAERNTRFRLLRTV